MWVVTGAAGFVGSHICEAFGPETRGLSRKTVPSWDVDSLTRAFRGARGVVHAASVVHRPETPAEEYQRFNVDGTRSVVEAARRAGVRRLIFLSSIKVHGETPVGIIDETTPLDASAHYARTKADAERIVLDAEDLHPIILRLCPVYGRGDKGNIRTMIRAIRRRRFLVPGDGGTRKSIVHVSTVADVAKAARESIAGGVFVVADRNTPTIRELANVIARELGRRAPWRMPSPILLAVAGLVERAAPILRIQTPVSQELIRKSLTDSVCDPSRAERELGVTCEVDLQTAIGDEIDWLTGIDHP